MIIDYKENTYVNIKEQKIINYVPAAGITSCYSVTFNKEKICRLFGKVIKKETLSETMPFFFKSFDIAKDFCEVFPTVISDVFVNSANYHNVKYGTYRLIKNDKIIGFIKWDDNYTYYSGKKEDEGGDNLKIGYMPGDKIVGSFVEDITLKDWIHTNSLKDVKFHNSCNKLSDLVNLIENKHKNISNGHEVIKEWNFKLVEQ